MVTPHVNYKRSFMVNPITREDRMAQAIVAALARLDEIGGVIMPFDGNRFMIEVRVDMRKVAAEVIDAISAGEQIEAQ